MCVIIMYVAICNINNDNVIMKIISNNVMYNMCVMLILICMCMYEKANVMYVIMQYYVMTNINNEYVYMCIVYGSSMLVYINYVYVMCV